MKHDELYISMHHVLFHLMSVNVSAARLSWTAIIRGNVHIQTLSVGMNAAVRATVRVGLYTGAKVYFVHEVNTISFPFDYTIFSLLCIVSNKNMI